ncbi:C39 family peptidase [Pantanalinema rosaneae CENA516]|uniref:C39 family peptidase n=1 Tax=Pantanalinema rosaneae TaxID=1620701 RepID=UPI003D6F9929
MAIQLRVVQNTVFKLTTENAAQLPANSKASVAAGRVFNIHSWKVVDQTHIRVALVGDFLGDPPRNTWCAYIPHIQLIEPASLRTIRNTVFKQSTADSSQLSAEEKVAVAAGRVFNLHSWGTAANNHIKLALSLTSLGNPARNTWYAFTPDIQFIQRQAQVVNISYTPPNPGGLPSTKRLNVPYKSQLDNVYNPTGACNVTSFAMVMAYFQIRGNTSIRQLEDELYVYMENNGLSRWDPLDLAKMSRAYGLVNDFTMSANLADIRKAIAEGRPCIIHGYFTSFGHIIVVRGYDQFGFFVNDPYGEWTSSGYRNDLTGENLHYSNALIQRKCSPEGENFIWLHRLAKAN